MFNDLVPTHTYLHNLYFVFMLVKRISYNNDYMIGKCVLKCQSY